MSARGWPTIEAACYKISVNWSVDAAGTVARSRLIGVMESALKHKFPIGATVYFTASNVSRPAASGTYEVIRLLPTEGDDCQYRIKSSTEAFERVAKESQLATP